MTVPHCYFVEPGHSALVTIDVDALGATATAWPAACSIDLAWRLPALARSGPVLCTGAASWERKGIWMTARLEAPSTGHAALRVVRPSDIDGDGFVDAADLSVLLGDWGGPEGRSDLNIDGKVDAIDQAILLGDWREVSGGAL